MDFVGQKSKRKASTNGS